MPKVITYETNKQSDFEAYVNESLAAGCTILSTNCMTFDAAECNFASNWQAILLQPDEPSVATEPDIILTPEQFFLLKRCVTVAIDNINTPPNRSSNASTRRAVLRECAKAQELSNLRDLQVNLLTGTCSNLIIRVN